MEWSNSPLKDVSITELGDSSMNVGTCGLLRCQDAGCLNEGVYVALGMQNPGPIEVMDFNVKADDTEKLEEGLDKRVSRERQKRE